MLWHYGYVLNDGTNFNPRNSYIDKSFIFFKSNLSQNLNIRDFEKLFELWHEKIVYNNNNITLCRQYCTLQGK